MQIVMDIQPGEIEVKNAIEGEPVTCTGTVTSVFFTDGAIDEKILDSEILQSLIDDGTVSKERYLQEKNHRK